MTLQSTATERARAQAASRPSAAIVSLAIVEARRLLLHPAMLALAALSGLLTALPLAGIGETNTGTDESFLYLLVSGFCCIPLGIGTFIAANLTASRSARDRTEPHYRSLPVDQGHRSAAHLLGLAAPVSVAVVLVSASWLASGAADGLAMTSTAGPIAVRPGPAELGQGPLFVAVMGALGIAASRWIRHPLAALLAIPAALPQLIGVGWMMESAGWWFAPMAQSLRIASWVEVSPAYSYPVLAGIDTDALGWHLLYLTGLGVLASAIALRGRRRASGLTAIAGVALLGIGGALQVIAGGA